MNEQKNYIYTLQDNLKILNKKLKKWNQIENSAKDSIHIDNSLIKMCILKQEFILKEINHVTFLLNLAFEVLHSETDLP